MYTVEYIIIWLTVKEASIGSRIVKIVKRLFKKTEVKIPHFQEICEWPYIFECKSHLKFKNFFAYFDDKFAAYFAKKSRYNYAYLV